MNICRTRFKKDIITEFCAPRDRSSNKVMIFCSGVPGSPHKDEVLDYWSQKGYWTFFPRYRGTWESSGTFLIDSPHEDLLDVIDCLNDSFTDYWSGEKFQFEPEFITIVGTSFGGPASILASLDKRVDKAVCISPVVDWVAEEKFEPLDKLYKLLCEAYGEAYRLDKRSWNKLKKGNFYNPVKHIKELDKNKIIIFHAKDDEIVAFKSVAKFAKRLKCEFVELSRGGHLSSSMLLGGKYYWKVKRFLKKNL